MILHIADIEKAFGIDTGVGVPRTYEAMYVLYRAARHGGVDAIEALRGVAAYHPRCILGILNLLGDDNIESVNGLVEFLPDRIFELGKSVEFMTAWVARQSVYRLLREKGLLND